MPAVEMVALALVLLAVGLTVSGVALVAGGGWAMIVAGILTGALGVALGRDRRTPQTESAQFTRG